MKESHKQIIYLTIGIALVSVVFSQALIKTYLNKTEYTIEIYDIFEVTHTENKQGSFTNVYTNGSGQFFFRGDHPINGSRAYVFTFEKNLKRWRDLTLIEYHEIRVLKRGID